MGELLEIGTQSRYDMSFVTYHQLQRDHIRFKEKYTEEFKNDFICRILINYMCYAQENFLDKFANDAVERLKMKQRDEYITNGRISFTTPLKEKISEFDFLITRSGSDYEFKYKKRDFVTYILEKFTRMSLAERENVYCYDQYKSIKDAIEKNEIIIVEHSSDGEFEVKPYDIRIDENTLSYYLIGYSRRNGTEDKFGIYSLKLSRIKKCRSTYKEAVLSIKERKAIEKNKEKFGCAYIAWDSTKEDIEEIIVRLTEHGYKDLYLKVISHQRPIPTKTPKRISLNGKERYDLVFDCSYQQIRNYFFSFGAEAEIVSPKQCREEFLADYKRSIERYNSD